VPAFAVVVALLVAPPIGEMPPAALDGYLAGLHERTPGFAGRIAEVAKRGLGTPYKGDPLGEGPAGAVDTDPLMDLGHVDCVTFVEQTIALAACDSYRAAFHTLQTIRYRTDEVAFENRNHFMAADWVKNNTFCRDVTGDLDTPTKTGTRTIGRKHFFQLKELPDKAREAVDETLDLTYVPADAVAQAEPHLPSPALILLIGKVNWLFTLHCGLYIRDETGQGRFYHASSQAGEVVAVGLAEYLRDSTRYIGFAAYAIAEPSKGKPE